MKISIIAVIGENNELGKNNKLLWRLKTDLKHFQEITSGHPIIMGRKTFESLGKALPKRRNIVITRNVDYTAPDIEVVHSLEDALTLVRQDETVTESFITGGEQIYREAIKIADKLYITHVEATDKDADAFFPEIIPIVFGETNRERYDADERNEKSYSFVEYIKF
ncbi:MAG: dihydrofolate reductase [Candidatus Nomurabacteria bacterium]|nr:dihydrofolate reductase [Candidatus Nomurabacteria bacterium]